MANRMSHNLDSRSNTVSWSVRNPAVPSVNNVADDADLASTVTLNSNCPMTQRSGPT